MAGAHRSSRQDTEATRDAILDAASTLFAERGYLATTVDDIAVAAQVATGTIYTSVGGKQQLLEAVVHRFVEPPASPDLPASPEAIAPPDEPEAIASPELPAAPVEIVEPDLSAEPVEIAEPDLPAEPVEIAEPDGMVLADAFDLITSGEVTVRLSPETIAASVDPRSVIGETVHANRLATEAFADLYDLIHRNGTMDGTVADSATAADERMRRAADQLALQLAELNALRTTVTQAVDLLAYFLGYLSWRRLVHDFGWSYDTAEAWLTERIGEALLIVEG
jgi:AcrR family transcriptional regulator